MGILPTAIPHQIITGVCVVSASSRTCCQSYRQRRMSINQARLRCQWGRSALRLPADPAGRDWAGFCHDPGTRFVLSASAAFLRTCLYITHRPTAAPRLDPFQIVRVERTVNYGCCWWTGKDTKSPLKLLHSGVARRNWYDCATNFVAGDRTGLRKLSSKMWRKIIWMGGPLKEWVILSLMKISWKLRIRKEYKLGTHILIIT